MRQPARVLGDDGRLRQVVANLVRNAMVHTPEGTPVEVTVDRVDGRAILEVRDEGPGMTEDVASKAFERFYRADPSRVRSRGGTGLGLAIVQATVAAHDGAVVLDTRPGRGTTVRIRFRGTHHRRTRLWAVSSSWSNTGRGLGVVVVECPKIGQELTTRRRVSVGHGVRPKHYDGQLVRSR